MSILLLLYIITFIIIFSSIIGGSAMKGAETLREEGFKGS